MVKERLRQLFTKYDPVIRQIVNEVTELEQQKITMRNPVGIHEEIDAIITRVAEQELERIQTEE